MKSTITSKGQITIPIRIRRRLNLKPGQILEFDESVPFLKASKAFNPQDMYDAIGCCRGASRLSAKEWLNQTRGPLDLAEDTRANRH
jgi:AbrB family looped-hinge helix DNA binding protein